MQKMNIAQASEHFGVSKEAIHNRIRRGSLKSVIEDGIKLVIIEATALKTSQTNSAKTRVRRTTVATTTIDEKYYQFIEDQNVKLQERVEKLEGETKLLREQKEYMLIQEREKVEQIYKDKDEQLKSILNAITSNFLPNTSTEEVLVHKEDHVEAEIEEVDNSVDEEKITKKSKLLSLKKYLKKSKFSKKKVKKIKAVFKKKAKKDKRVVKIGKKYYLDSKYDYSDLLSF